jgi:hypothetical protein
VYIVVSWIVCMAIAVLCILWSPMCICCTVGIDIFPLVAGLLARGQYSEGLATGHLDTGFSWFPLSLSKCCVGSQDSQVATTCFSYSPPDINLVANQFHVLYAC